MHGGGLALVGWIVVLLPLFFQIVSVVGFLILAIHWKKLNQDQKFAARILIACIVGMHIFSLFHTSI